MHFSVHFRGNKVYVWAFRKQATFYIFWNLSLCISWIVAHIQLYIPEKERCVFQWYLLLFLLLYKYEISLLYSYTINSGALTSRHFLYLYNLLFLWRKTMSEFFFFIFWCIYHVFKKQTYFPGIQRCDVRSFWWFARKIIFE